jgi:hypothetical protein
MSYTNLGDFNVDSTVIVDFDTFDNTGLPVTITGLALADIKVYKDGGITQRSSTSGFTLLDTDGIDVDGITGQHGFSLDLSDNTDAGFWAAGSDYKVVVDNITVNGITVSFIAAIFSIENRTGTASVVADAVWDEVASGHTTAGTFGKQWRQIHQSLSATEGSISDAGPTTTDFDTDLTETGTYWQDAVMIFEDTAANAGLARTITVYDGVAKNVSFDEPWPVTPVNGDAFQIIARHVHTLSQIRDSILPPINTALSNIEFLMVDDTNQDPATGLTVSGTRSIDGGAFAAVSGTIAEVGNGIYQFDASAADMNGTIITFRFTAAAAEDTFVTIKTGG